MIENFLWVEKYRPKKISDCILPRELELTFQDFVNQENIPNLLLCGGPGVGKTTVAKAMVEELGCSYYVINGSLHGNIDTLRNEIMNFASSVSFDGKRKYVILDEADYLNASSTQPALRNFMEEFSKNCGFILTCNYKNRIIKPLQSRCSTIEFNIPKDEKVDVANKFFFSIQGILKQENVKFDKKVLAEVIQRYFPDWRKILNELQRYSGSGEIDSGIFVNLSEEKFEDLIGLLRDRKFGQMRKWVAQNTDYDSSVIYRKLYDHASLNMKPESIPQLVVTLADYQYKEAFVADAEINTVAMLAEVMVNCEFQE